MGAAAYARQLAAEARRFTLVRSELIEGTNRILRYVTWAIVPIAGLWVLSHRLHWAERERRSGRPSYEDQGPGTPLAMDSGPRRAPGE